MPADEATAQRIQHLSEALTRGSLQDNRTSTTQASFSFEAAQREFAANTRKSLDDYANKRINGRQLEQQWRRQVRASMPKAAAAGAAQWGHALGSHDQFWLRGAIKQEQGFISNFAKQLRQGKVSLKQAQARLDQYTRALDSARIHTWVEKAPHDIRIYWRLGIARHCPDCLVLDANSPYTRKSLPTVPRAGMTQCKGRCACSLEVVRVRRKGRRRAAPPPSPTVQDVNGFGSGLVQGTVQPSVDQVAKINDLRARINYHRRMIAQTTGEARKAAIAARKAANRELIDYTAQNQIRDVPMASVSEVVTGQDVAPRALEEVMLRGLDGTTVLAVEAEMWAAYTRQMKAEVDALIDELP